MKYIDMTSTTSSLTLFINQISSLNAELVDMYPNDLDIRICKNTVDTVKKLNPKIIVDTFYNHVYSYKTQIMTKNEAFFIDMNYNAVIKDDNMSIVSNLKKYWSSMSDETKECMWQYFSVLIVLCEKCKGII
jgi:hypothetical protein